MQRDGKDVCTHCRKRIHYTRGTAILHTEARNRKRKKGDPTFVEYPCDVDRKTWHVGSERRKISRISKTHIKCKSKGYINTRSCRH